jgi:hypothetical protein
MDDDHHRLDHLSVRQGCLLTIGLGVLFWLIALGVVTCAVTGCVK